MAPWVIMTMWAPQLYVKQGAASKVSITMCRIHELNPYDVHPYRHYAYLSSSMFITIEVLWWKDWLASFGIGLVLCTVQVNCVTTSPLIVKGLRRL